MFNIRVYGLSFNEAGELLTCREGKAYNRILKFPGGGLDYGEGLIDALKREFLEELETSITVDKHIYTTDFFQKSYFDASQVIAVYYQVTLPKDVVIPCTKGELAFQYEPINRELLSKLSMPIDKYVLERFYLVSR